MDYSKLKDFLKNATAKDFLETATTAEQGAVGHILLFILIFMCLFTIVNVTYSNMLIDKLKLEDKFPILVNMIRFRNEFQHFIFFFNVFFIVLVLSYGIYLNLYVLYLYSN